MNLTHNTASITKLETEIDRAGWICRVDKKYRKKDTVCELTDCLYHLYCDWISQRPREILTKTQIYRRSNCYFYEWQTHHCIKKDIETCRAVCAFCSLHVQRSKWQITFHITLVDPKDIEIPYIPAKKPRIKKTPNLDTSRFT